MNVQMTFHWDVTHFSRGLTIIETGEPIYLLMYGTRAQARSPKLLNRDLGAGSMEKPHRKQKRVFRCLLGKL